MSLAIWDHIVLYEWIHPAVTLARWASTRFTYPEGWKANLTQVTGYIQRWFITQSRADPVQACCSCVQVFAQDSTIVSRQWAPVQSWLRDSEMAAPYFLTITACPLYTAVHRQWLGFPCCCCPYLEQSAPSPNMSCPHPLCLFSGDASGIPSHGFYRNFYSICTVTVVIFRYFNCSCYLLTYL